jgi:hypothetical protein
MSQPTAQFGALFIPVVLGTARQGRMSEHIAFVFGEMSKQPGVETEYVDIRTLKIWTSEAGDAVKDHRFPRSFPAPTVSCLLRRNTITVFAGS